MSDGMTLDGITYTFPLGDKTTVMVGDSTDVSALYSTACTYSAFTDLLSNCGSGTAAGLGGGGTTSISSATILHLMISVTDLQLLVVFQVKVEGSWIIH